MRGPAETVCAWCLPGCVLLSPLKSSQAWDSAQFWKGDVISIPRGPQQSCALFKKELPVGRSSQLWERLRQEDH